MNKVWFITGAGRGMGVNIATAIAAATLAGGNTVIANRITKERL